MALARRRKRQTAVADHVSGQKRHDPRAILPVLVAMAEALTPVEIPNRALFKAAEVCDLVKLQPYVLRSWESEFPDLGVTKSRVARACIGAPMSSR